MRHEGVGVVQQQLEMLGGEVVHDVGRLVEVADQHRLRVAQRRVDDRPASGVLDRFGEGLGNAFDQIGVG